ncbi:hypothetical protein JL722_4813 [Aureococcus anophagefferens]|nr:hypothetical protein JL722_4813 [Aureococcus anophagefferens]
MASFQEAELRGLGNSCRICRRFGDDDDTEDPMAVLESACDCEGQARVGCVLARAQKSGLWTRCGACKATFKASAVATRCALAVGRAEALDGRAADRGALAEARLEAAAVLEEAGRWREASAHAASAARVFELAEDRLADVAEARGVEERTLARTDAPFAQLDAGALSPPSRPPPNRAATGTAPSATRSGRAARRSSPPGASRTAPLLKRAARARRATRRRRRGAARLREVAVACLGCRDFETAERAARDSAAAFDLDESVDCRGDDDVKRALAAAVAARDKADLGRAEDVISRVRRTGAKGAADAFCPACAARPGTHESGCVCVACGAALCSPCGDDFALDGACPACGEPLFGGATTQEAYLDALRGRLDAAGPGLDSRGQTNALNLLAAAHVEGQRDGAEAEQYRAALEAAESGDAAALFELARHEAFGLGCDRDARRAAALYEDAARLGHGEAASDLGVCYETGDGVEPDAAAAAAWYEAGARLGSAAARFNLGCFKLRTAFKPTDVAEAADLFRQAADAGHVTALRNLAVLYEEGQGVDKDVAEAARLERRADALEEGGVEEEKDDPPTPAPPASLPPGGPRRPRGGRA